VISSDRKLPAESTASAADPQRVVPALVA